MSTPIDPRTESDATQPDGADAELDETQLEDVAGGLADWQDWNDSPTPPNSGKWWDT